MDKKLFCDSCHKDVAYTVQEEEIKTTLKGEDYYYTGKVAVCNECKSYIHSDELEDENLRILYELMKINGLLKPITEDMDPDDLFVYVPENTNGNEGFVLKVLVGMIIVFMVITAMILFIIFG